MPSRRATVAGFSLVGLLLATTITLVILIIALKSLDSAATVSETGSLLTDLNLSLRSSLNIVTRDLMSAGRDIPVGGIPIPSGGGATPLVRPSADGTAFTFPVGGVTLPAVSPGDGIGLPVNGIPSDMISIVMVDSTPMCATSLALGDRFLTNASADGSTITIDPAIPIGCAGGGIVPGDLIMVSAGASVLHMVTAVNGQIITLGGGDPMNLNQQGAAAQGTLVQLQNGPGTYPAEIEAHRIRMTSYYLNTAIVGRPRLMRRLNLFADGALGIGIENLKITYDLVDGATNPVNQPAPVAPNTPHQIRSANVFIS